MSEVVASYNEEWEMTGYAYPPEGCRIMIGREKCGETRGLDIIMDFHKLYQEKMSQIDVSAGGDSLQEKVDLQQQWIKDLTDQNKMLARVIEELESEAIGRVQQLENKLNNATKSLGENDKDALNEKDKKIRELEEALKQLPTAEELKNKSQENEQLKKNDRSSERLIKSIIPDTPKNSMDSSKGPVASETRKVSTLRQRERSGSNPQEPEKMQKKPVKLPNRSLDTEEKTFLDAHILEQPIFVEEPMEVLASSVHNGESGTETDDPPESHIVNERDEFPEVLVLSEVDKDIASVPQDLESTSEATQISELPMFIEENEKLPHLPSCYDQTCPNKLLSETSASLRSKGDKNLNISKSDKSVHLMIEDETELLVVEPEKTFIPKVSKDYYVPHFDSVPVVGTADSIELTKRVPRTPNSSRASDLVEESCICGTTTFWDEFEKLKVENKMLLEGGEIQRLRDEVDEKLKRIIELNEENRALNDMINVLREKNDFKRPAEPSSESDAQTSDSEYIAECACRVKNQVKKRKVTCKEKCGYQQKDVPEFIKMSRKICVCREINATKTLPQNAKKESPTFIDVYHREKGNFISDSSSTVCNEEICPFLSGTCTNINNRLRARGGNDNEIPCPPSSYYNQSDDAKCSNRDIATETIRDDVDAVFCGYRDIAINCTNVSCLSEGCTKYEGDFGPPKRCKLETCLNTTCFDERFQGTTTFEPCCYDETCPNKDQFQPRVPSFTTSAVDPFQTEVTAAGIPPQASVFTAGGIIPDSVLAPTCDRPVACVDATCEVPDCEMKSSSWVENRILGICDSTPVTCNDKSCAVPECLMRTTADISEYVAPQETSVFPKSLSSQGMINPIGSVVGFPQFDFPPNCVCMERMTYPPDPSCPCASETLTESLKKTMAASASLSESQHSPQKLPLQQDESCFSSEEPVELATESYQSSEKPAIRPEGSQHSSEKPVTLFAESHHSAEKPVVQTESSFHSSEKPIAPITESYHSSEEPAAPGTESYRSSEKPDIPAEMSSHSSEKPAEETTGSYHSAEKTVIPAESSHHSSEKPIAPVTESYHSSEKQALPTAESHHSSEKAITQLTETPRSSEKIIVPPTESHHSSQKAPTTPILSHHSSLKAIEAENEINPIGSALAFPQFSFPPNCICMDQQTYPPDPTCPCLVLPPGTDITIQSISPSHSVPKVPSVCICGAPAQCQGDTSTQKPLIPVISIYSSPGVTATPPAIEPQSSSFAHAALPQVGGQCPRGVCETCACIRFPKIEARPRTAVYPSTSSHMKSSGSGRCAKGICETCACIVFPEGIRGSSRPATAPPKIPQQLNENEPAAVEADEVEVCAICGCTLSPSDIIPGQVCDVEVDATPQLINATTSAQASPTFECDIENLEIQQGDTTDLKFGNQEESDSKEKGPSDTVTPPIKEDPVPTKKPAPDMCSEEYCRIVCACNEAPNTTKLSASGAQEFQSSPAGCTTSTPCSDATNVTVLEQPSEKPKTVLPKPEYKPTPTGFVIGNPCPDEICKEPCECRVVASTGDIYDSETLVDETPNATESFAPGAQESQSLPAGCTTSTPCSDATVVTVLEPPPEKPLTFSPLPEYKPTPTGFVLGNPCPDEICQEPCECKVVASAGDIYDSETYVGKPSRGEGEQIVDKAGADPCEIVCPCEPLEGKGSANIETEPSSTIGQKPTGIMSETPPAQISEAEGEKPIVTEKPSKSASVKASTGGTCEDRTCSRRYPKKEGQIETDKSLPASLLPPSEGTEIIRCVCKSKFCKIVPDPQNPRQKLCVDASKINIEEECICNPSCPVDSTDIADDSLNQTGRLRECDVNPLKETPVYTIHKLMNSNFREAAGKAYYRLGEPTDSSANALSKEEEYAGLSRKEQERYRTSKYISPRKARSCYGLQDEEQAGDKTPEAHEEMKNADLKLIIADLKSKLLDADERIEELKLVRNDLNKDNNTALIEKYSEEIEDLKKSLKWSRREKEEYEYLKEKVKLLEQGKGDTQNVTSNLQTAEDKVVMKTQLKKLSKKNKCYEEVVKFFKDEMSVMSDELLTLQEVLNATNVCSQEENNKLINAILQLRRINDRLVAHICTIEKQVVLENQINKINEARINELQSIVGVKNNDLNQHDEIIRDMRKKLSNATKQNADLKKTIKNLTDTVVEIQEGIKKVEREQHDNKTEVSVVESKVCLANGNLEDIKVCVLQKNNRINELENKLKEKQIGLILATKELEMLKEKKSENKELINSLREQLNSSEIKMKQMIGDYQNVSKQLQDYTNLEHMKNYELNHYKSLVEEMRMSLVQMNNGLEQCEASNIHFYDDPEHPNELFSIQEKNSNLSVAFDDLRKSMSDMRRRLTNAEFKGGLIEEELLKVRESHMSYIKEETSETQRELEARVFSSIEEQSRLNQLVVDQKHEIEKLRKDLKREKEISCSCKKSVSELKNEKMNSNAQMEISHLKGQLNKSFQRQRVLSEENDKLHTQMINLTKKLTMMEQVHEELKHEHEQSKLQLKKTLRENEYLLHRKQELMKTIEQLKNTYETLEKQCRTMMKKISEDKRWVKTPLQQPLSLRRCDKTPTREHRVSSPSKYKRSERTAETKYRPSSPWRCLSAYLDEDFKEDDLPSMRSNQLRDIPYDSNSLPYSSRSPSPRSDYSPHEDEFNTNSLKDWFSSNYKETDTDADEGEDDAFINKVEMMTAQVQEANKKWQLKMNKDHLFKPRLNNK